LEQKKLNNLRRIARRIRPQINSTSIKKIISDKKDLRLEKEEDKLLRGKSKKERLDYDKIKGSARLNVEEIEPLTDSVKKDKDLLHSKEQNHKISQQNKIIEQFPKESSPAQDFISFCTNEGIILELFNTKAQEKIKVIHLSLLENCQLSDEQQIFIASILKRSFKYLKGLDYKNKIEKKYQQTIASQLKEREKIEQQQHSIKEEVESYEKEDSSTNGSIDHKNDIEEDLHIEKCDKTLALVNEAKIFLRSRLKRELERAKEFTSSEIEIISKKLLLKIGLLYNIKIRTFLDKNAFKKKEIIFSFRQYYKYYFERRHIDIEIYQGKYGQKELAYIWLHRLLGIRLTKEQKLFFKAAQLLTENSGSLHNNDINSNISIKREEPDVVNFELEPVYDNFQAPSNSDKGIKSDIITKKRFPEKFTKKNISIIDDKFSNNKIITISPPGIDDYQSLHSIAKALRKEFKTILVEDVIANVINTQEIYQIRKKIRQQKSHLRLLQLEYVPNHSLIELNKQNYLFRKETKKFLKLIRNAITSFVSLHYKDIYPKDKAFLKAIGFTDDKNLLQLIYGPDIVKDYLVRFNPPAVSEQFYVYMEKVLSTHKVKRVQERIFSCDKKLDTIYPKYEENYSLIIDEQEKLASLKEELNDTFCKNKRSFLKKIRIREKIKVICRNDVDILESLHFYDDDYLINLIFRPRRLRSLFGIR